MPAEQPIYVHSFVYLFGIATVASFILLILSGVILSIFGPQWWHSSNVGHFFNSVHFWSVQAFFSGAWRDGRGLTWVSGVVTFLVSILTAFTGYLSQQNFDAQWIGVQGKDALNAVGVGAFFDALNFGQMYGFHIVVLPVIVAGLVGLHLLLVRLRGVVRPYEIDSRSRGAIRSDEIDQPSQGAIQEVRS